MNRCFVQIERLSCLMSVLCVMAMPPMAQARSESCVPTDEQEVAHLFDRWNVALGTGDAAVVTALYAPGSVLLPTLSRQPRISTGEKEAYFREFLSLRPVGTVDLRRIRIDCNAALDTGLYTFALADGRRVQARYTFAYGWDGAQWRITAHHSSLMPDRD